jgi:outer membrane translocation and assembly module TamA
VRVRGLRHAWGAALALDTPLGPLSIGYGRAEAKYDRLYLNLGFDF